MIKRLRVVSSGMARPTSMFAVAAILCGCMAGPRYVRPSTEVPMTYKEAATDATASTPGALNAPSTARVADRTDAGFDGWWLLFGDARLNELQQQVIVSNQNLAYSEAAYRQAQFLIREQRSTLFPTFTLDASASRVSGEGSSSVSSTTGGTSSGGNVRKSYELSGNASWEIDLWGRLRRALENARALADASAADLAYARLSIQGELAIAYLQLREVDAEHDLVMQTVDGYSRSLQIAQNRYAAGVAAKSDVLQAQTQLANTQQQGVALALQRAQLEHAIAALIGKPAGNFALAAQADWRPLVPDIPVSLPSELLRRRPDIAAAERRVAAANAAIGVQQADYFPSLVLTATRGLAAAAIDDLFGGSAQFRSVGASAGATVLDFGGRRARVAEARAAYEQTVAQYRQTVLTAFQAVEDDLASARLLTQEHEFLRTASEAADEAERLAMNQYKAGTVSYTEVVVAQAAALGARRSLATAALDRQTAAVSLITALGGGWNGASRP